MQAQQPEEGRHLPQFGAAILTSLISLALVIGGLSLALSEGRTAPPPPTFAGGAGMLPSPTDTAPAVFPSETPTLFLIIGTPTNAYPANQTPFVFTPPSTSSASANTPVSCGPPFSWVKTYVVAPGDTLFRIAQNYYTTTAELQRANCKGTSTNINVGERLWVPNVATRTPGVTVIPDFPTATPVPTEPLTETPLPFTASPSPTQTPPTPDS